MAGCGEFEEWALELSEGANSSLFSCSASVTGPSASVSHCCYPSQPLQPKHPRPQKPVDEHVLTFSQICDVLFSSPHPAAGVSNTWTMNEAHNRQPLPLVPESDEAVEDRCQQIFDSTLIDSINGLHDNKDPPVRPELRHFAATQRQASTEELPGNSSHSSSCEGVGAAQLHSCTVAATKLPLSPSTLQSHVLTHSNGKAAAAAAQGGASCSVVCKEQLHCVSIPCTAQRTVDEELKEFVFKCFEEGQTWPSAVEGKRKQNSGPAEASQGSKHRKLGTFNSVVVPGPVSAPITTTHTAQDSADAERDLCIPPLVHSMEELSDEEERVLRGKVEVCQSSRGKQRRLVRERNRRSNFRREIERLRSYLPNSEGKDVVATLAEARSYISYLQNLLSHDT